MSPFTDIIAFQIAVRFSGHEFQIAICPEIRTLAGRKLEASPVVAGALGTIVVAPPDLAFQPELGLTVRYGVTLLTEDWLAATLMTTPPRRPGPLACTGGDFLRGHGAT